MLAVVRADARFAVVQRQVELAIAGSKTEQDATRRVYRITVAKTHYGASPSPLIASRGR
jgi:hypothetical protein